MKSRLHPSHLLTALLLAFAAGMVSPARSTAQSSEQPTYLKVGEAKTKKPVIALTTGSASSENASARLKIVSQTIQSDLAFTDQFKLLPEAGFAQPKITGLAEVKFPEWAKAGADYVSFGTFSEEKGQLVYEFHLVNVGSNHEAIAKKFIADKEDAKTLGHAIANDIVQAITLKRGIFLTRIAFVCDKSGKKEIYTSAFDGSDVRQITRLRSLSMGPAWSPDGTRLAFSVYNRHSDNVKNIDMYEIAFKTGALRLLSNRKGINSGAAYSPDGNKIAYTMSHTGNPEIHLLDLETRETTQITRSIGFDVDPNFSPDGRMLAMVSSRAGKPMIYTVHLSNPSEVKRLTYAGSYNATPSWSPDGKKIAFAGWIDRHFDLFLITADGSKIERLTKDEGNNEDPYYSPDGNFLVFSSSRAGGKNIYLMGVDGGNLKRLTFGMGNCTAPKWSPYLQ
jgi:TolB protein